MWVRQTAEDRLRKSCDKSTFGCLLLVERPAVDLEVAFAGQEVSVGINRHCPASFATKSPTAMISPFVVTMASVRAGFP